MKEPKHHRIRIYGKVQGVFFRASARQEAERLGIKGFARNERDGSVYIEAEGDDERLKSFLEWCNQGPSRAKVERIETEEGALKNFSKFEVNRY